jgi:4-amino-4-deoxy-L-arabinose transferase-like glycosyltransferase
VLLGIVLLSAVLNFANFDALGDGNLYYTAAVVSMRQSFSNFFFLAAEPGGSVSVDKPPLGLWLQTVSAMIFGVNGFGVILPQILAGMCSIVLLYHLVARRFGTAAGLIAAFVLATTPISIAIQRSNVLDPILIVFLLAAAWAFLKATETNRFDCLLLGCALVGAAFNVKMLQAYLPLPALYALYILGAKANWRLKITRLALATALLLVVSLAWIIIVDLIPPDQRPRVAASTVNSTFEQMVNTNGIQRLFGPSPIGIGGGGELGDVGLLRLFVLPLANEIAWLLPFGLFALVLLLSAAPLRLPVVSEHQSALLWGGWLLIGIILFSGARFYHAYYLATLAPPLSALVGIGVMRLWAMREKSWVVPSLAMAALLTLTHQIWIAHHFIDSLWWAAGAAVVLLISAVLLFRITAESSHRVSIGFVGIVLAMLMFPTLWAVLTTLDEDLNMLVPQAYADLPLTENLLNSAQTLQVIHVGESQVNAVLLDYLQAHTQDTRYLMAVPHSFSGAAYVIETTRPVLYLGGFNGTDQVVDAAELARLIEAGDLRYIWADNGRGGSGIIDGEVRNWVQTHCSVVTDLSAQIQSTVYVCRP